MRSDPGVTAPHIIPVERDYPATYERFTSIGPLMEKIGNGGKGIAGTPERNGSAAQAQLHQADGRRKASRC
ncbi:hypothetical protein EZJ13_23920 [Enterobacter hormaechei]|nr:hypothetical protein EZJ13_23920 [Enterobacter hormaechei]